MDGSGEITLIVDMTIVELSDVNREITIDSVLQEAYSGNPSMNSCVSGNFPSFPPGNSTISWTGNVTYLKVELTGVTSNSVCLYIPFSICYNILDKIEISDVNDRKGV